MSTSTVPSFEASGQLLGPSLLRSTSASEQAARPLAAEGFTAIPSGRVTQLLCRDWRWQGLRGTSLRGTVKVEFEAQRGYRRGWCVGRASRSARSGSGCNHPLRAGARSLVLSTFRFQPSAVTLAVNGPDVQLKASRGRGVLRRRSPARVPALQPKLIEVSQPRCDRGADFAGTAPQCEGDIAQAYTVGRLVLSVRWP